MLLDAVPTEGQMLGRMEPREQELWYLTQHFADLQGLKIMPIFVAFGLLLCFLPSRPMNGVVALFGVLVLAVVCMAWMQRWYEARYGLVRSSRTKPEMLPGFLPTAWALLLVMLVLSIRSHVSSSGATFLVAVSTLLLPKCFYLTPKSGWVRLRAWLYRSGAATLTGLISYAAVMHVSHDTGRLILMGYCAVFVLLGLYDHWLLGRLARPSGRVAVDAG